jgi:uncharacterized protein (DUF1330 family)
VIEILTVARVTDADTYGRYRAEMTPLLEARGGSFGVDVIVDRVLHPRDAAGFDRLFTIRFPSLEEMEAFFGDPRYLEIRRRLFDPSVAEIRRLGRYAVLPDG